MSSPCIPLPNRDVRGKRRIESNDSGPLVLNYSNNQPMIPSSWNRAHCALSVFGMDETSEIDTKNMTQSISRIINYITNNLAYKKGLAKDFTQVIKAFWSLILAIYSSRWDILPIKDSKTFCNLVGKRILNSYIKCELLNQSEVEKLLPSMPTIAMNSNIPAAPPSSKTTGPIEKKVLKPMTMKKTYAQASKSNTSSNIEDVLWVKEVFPALSADKVGKMLKAKNSGIDNKKPKINMMTRELSRREVIISMTKVNTKLIVNSAYIHISNINNCLKNAKSDIIADFI